MVGRFFVCLNLPSCVCSDHLKNKNNLFKKAGHIQLLVFAPAVTRSFCEKIQIIFDTLYALLFFK